MADGTYEDYLDRLARVQEYIASHLDDPLPLEHLAALAHFSPYHFHRIFSGMCGESVASYVRRLRLERAARELSADIPVIRLALDAGYDSHEAFTRAFKTHFGITPTAMRRAGGFSTIAASLHGTGRIANSIHQKGGCLMDVQIKKISEQNVVYLRHVGPYQDCGATWERLCRWACPKGVFGPDTMIMGICHDDPEITPPEQIRYDACLTIDRAIDTDEGIQMMHLPEGTYASYLHKGPYDQLKNSYRKLCGEWIPQSGHQIANAPSIEVYLNSPDQTPAHELLTEIRIPLEQ